MRNISILDKHVYIRVVKLTAKVRLKPTDEQAELLLQTMQEANAACDRISVWAWNNKTARRPGFGQYKIHHGTYHDIKASTRLSAQAVVRCVSKVADSYKLDRKRMRQFRKYGSIGYDARILSWKTDKRIASVWTVEPGRRAGRQKIPYVTGEHHAKLLQYQQGESDLCYIKGKFYLHTTCKVPDTEPDRRAEQLSEDVLGVDLGIKNIATDSDGEAYEGQTLNELRKAREKTRASLQSRGTRSAKRVLKRISGREQTTTKIANHTIAKALVAKAKQESKAICLEELKGIRQTTNKRLRRSQRGLHNRWSFHQLRMYIAYKAKREGVQMLYVPPAYTSKTCSCCQHVGQRNGEVFKCKNCGYSGHSDHNAAENIRSWGRSVNRPEKSVLNCMWPVPKHISISGLKLSTVDAATSSR